MKVASVRDYEYNKTDIYPRNSVKEVVKMAVDARINNEEKLRRKQRNKERGGADNSDILLVSGCMCERLKVEDGVTR